MPGHEERVRSLAYRTDLVFARFGGTVLERGAYTVILTESNPGYHWGNYILFDDGPRRGDLARWKDLFDEELGKRIKAGHYAFGWDLCGEEAGEVEEFLEAGFNLNRSLVLTAEAVVKPAKSGQTVVVRELVEDREWEEATRGQIECRGPGHEYWSYCEFMRLKMQGYRDMSLAGLGKWFGAFLDGSLVASLGIFRDGTVGRFQNVVTNREHRNKGICRALVYETSVFALMTMGIERLVMVADEDYFAARIYESLGFRPTEHQYGLDWWETKV